MASVELDAATAVTPDEDATLQLAAIPKDASGSPLAGRVVQWTSSDESVARVADGGPVTAVRQGMATITASVEGSVGRRLAVREAAGALALAAVPS